MYYVFSRVLVASLYSRAAKLAIEVSEGLNGAFKSELSPLEERLLLLRPFSDSRVRSRGSAAYFEAIIGGFNNKSHDGRIKCWRVM
jgi:hypothetical protein